MSPILTHDQRIHSAANDDQAGDQFARREHILHPDVQLDADDVDVSYQTWNTSWYNNAGPFMGAKSGGNVRFFIPSATRAINLSTTAL